MHSACIFNSRAHMRGCRSGGDEADLGFRIIPPPSSAEAGPGGWRGGRGGVGGSPPAPRRPCQSPGGGGVRVFLPSSSSFLPLITTCQAAGDGGTRGGPPLPALAWENRPPWAASRQRRRGSPCPCALALPEGRSRRRGTVWGCPLCSGAPKGAQSPLGGDPKDPGAGCPPAMGLEGVWGQGGYACCSHPCACIQGGPGGAHVPACPVVPRGPVLPPASPSSYRWAPVSPPHPPAPLRPPPQPW